MALRFPEFRAALRGLRRWWIPLTAVYVLWVGFVFGIEGAARYACRVPGQDWIADGETPAERLRRNARYNEGMACLKATQWHSNVEEVLPETALVWPCIALAAYASRVLRRGGFVGLFDDPIIYGAVFTGTLILSYLPILGSMLFFQHFGFAGP